MKKIIAISLAVMLAAALLCACGETTIKSTISAEYDDGFAASYATSTSTDQNGNTTYEFTEEKYESFVYDYKNSLDSGLESEIAGRHDEPYGQYIYMDEEANAIYVGLNEGDYDEAIAEEEAAIVAEGGYKFFGSLETPPKSFSVVFCNAGNRDIVYGTYEFNL